MTGPAAGLGGEDEGIEELQDGPLVGCGEVGDLRQALEEAGRFRRLLLLDRLEPGELVGGRGLCQ